MKKAINVFKKKMPLIVALFALLSVSFLQLFGLTASAASHMFPETEKPTVVVHKSCKLPDDNTPIKIVIKSQGINLPVVPVTMQNGTWKVNDGVANYATETSKISGKTGNVGIFAHDLKNGFTDIKNLKEGETIKIFTTGQIATYKVYSTETTDPSSVNTFYPTQTPTLTLVTCDGIFSQQRFIVKAQLVSIQKGNCNV